MAGDAEGSSNLLIPRNHLASGSLSSASNAVPAYSGSWTTFGTGNFGAISAGGAVITSGTAIFSNSNGVGFGVNGQTVTASHNGLTTARASNDAIGLNTAQTNVTWTVNSSGLSLNASGYAGTGFTSTTTAGTAIVGTHNTSGLSLGVPAYITTARGSTDAVGLNTAQTNVTWTVNSSGLSLNAGGYAGTGFTSTTTAGTAIVATNNTSGLSIGVPAFLTTAMASNRGSDFVQATAAFAGTNATGTIASNGISVSVAAPGGATLSEYAPVGATAPITNSALGQNSIYIYPFDLPQAVSAYRLNVFFSIGTTLQASNSTNSAGLTMSAAIYTRGSGASTTQMLTLWSGSFFIRMSNSSNTQVAVTHPLGISNSTAVSTTSNGTVSNATASNYLVNSVGGFRAVPIPLSSTLTPGRYWFAAAMSTTSSNVVGVLGASMMMQTISNQIAFRPFGTSSAASDASFYQMDLPGAGTYSATMGAFPSVIGLTSNDIRAAVTITMPYFNFSAYTTGTGQL